MEPTEKKRRLPVVLFQGAENILAWVFLLILAVLTTSSFLLRIFDVSILGYDSIIRHLVLVIGCVGAMITSRENRHLALTGGGKWMETKLGAAVKAATAFLSVSISTAFFWSALSCLFIGFEPGTSVGWFPVQLFYVFMPIAFLVISVRFFLKSPKGAQSKVAVAAGFLLGTFLGLYSIGNILGTLLPSPPDWVWALQGLWSSSGIVALILIFPLLASLFLGTPIFIVLGGLGFLLFMRAGGAPEIIPLEGYNLLTNQAIPAIPLFTLAGFLLSESKAGERLVRLFKNLFGWLPGGVSVAAVLVATFFTTFTGASGVTILALGGLLYTILRKSENHTESFSIGMVTATGAIGLLFPPSLAIILYGAIAQINIAHLFAGGVLPGILLTLSMAAAGVFVAVRKKLPKVKFDGKEALASLKESFWEILLPVVICTAYFTGLVTLVETGALAVVYVLVIETIVHREIPWKKLPGVALKAVPIIGGVLIVLAVAKGLSYFIIDSGISQALAEWVRVSITSPVVFLLLLNLVLLVVGCLMDIFSAILVVAPLIIPLGAVFGIDPIHLGVIFIANLSIGFITPPVGLNLFLSSFRFEKPLGKIYKSVVPFFLIQLAIMLLITYVPWFSTVLVPG